MFKSLRWQAPLLHVRAPGSNSAKRMLIASPRTMTGGISKVQTENAPKAIGPYSQAIVANGMIFTSGQIPLVPATMKLVEGDVKAQARQVFQNLRAVLQAAGGDLNSVVKVLVFLKDMNDFGSVNEVYSEFFKAGSDAHLPARSAVQVARLPMDVLVEVECVALQS